MKSYLNIEPRYSEEPQEDGYRRKPYLNVAPGPLDKPEPPDVEEPPPPPEEEIEDRDIREPPPKEPTER